MAGCADSTSREPSDEAASTSPSRSTAPSAPTSELDSIAVIGHSGATGANSDPSKPNTDARENSWATGNNPAVRSLYLRLLATHPRSGETASTRLSTAPTGRTSGPSPVAWARSSGRSSTSDHTQAYVVSQWATAANYQAAIEDIPDAVAQNTGSGLCDLFDTRGRPRPAAARNLQAIVDLYWATTVKTCGGIPRCFTDGGVEQGLVPQPRDLAYDYNHLSVSGHRKFAQLSWSALPAAIRDRE